MNGNYYTPEELYYMDAGITCLGNDIFRTLIAKAISRAPKEVGDRFYDECIVLAINPEELGAFITREVLDGKHVLLFPYELWEWARDKQMKTILHEVAHFALEHKSPERKLDTTFTEWLFSSEKDEDDAWALVRKWLKDYERSSNERTSDQG